MVFLDNQVYELSLQSFYFSSLQAFVLLSIFDHDNLVCKMYFLLKHTVKSTFGHPNDFERFSSNVHVHKHISGQLIVFCCGEYWHNYKIKVIPWTLFAKADSPGQSAPPILILKTWVSL